jgi:hypothetical protein
MVVHTCNPSYEKALIGGSCPRQVLVKNVKPYPKNRATILLPHKLEALSSDFGTTKK